MKVSVLIPLYNKRGYIESTIASVEMQQYDGEIELVVWDDCSTDDSFEVARKYCEENYTRGEWKVLKGDKNGGTAYATNRCDENATGEVRFLLGADDVCHPLRLKMQLEVMFDTGCMVVDSYLMYEGNMRNFIVKPHTPDGKRNFASGGNNPCNGGTLAWRKEAREAMVRRDGRFWNEGMRHAEDIEFSLRAVRYFDVYGSPNILYIARRGDDNKTAWKERGEAMPEKRKEDLAHIEEVRKQLYGVGKKRGGFFS